MLPRPDSLYPAVRQLMLAQALTWQGLAHRAGMPTFELERALQRGRPSLQTILTTCDALKCSLAELESAMLAVSTSEVSHAP